LLAPTAMLPDGSAADPEALMQALREEPGSLAMLEAQQPSLVQAS
jgi:hypothetical protein